MQRWFAFLQSHVNLTLLHPLNTTYCPRLPPFPTQSQKFYQISHIKKENFKANTTSFSSEIVLSLHHSVLIFISPSTCTCIHNMFICPPRSRLCRPLGTLPYNQWSILLSMPLLLNDASESWHCHDGLRLGAQGATCVAHEWGSDVLESKRLVGSKIENTVWVLMLSGNCCE